MGVQSTPPPAAPGSPMRVTRNQRTGGPTSDPPPSPLSRRHGSLDGQEGSPRINIHRVHSPRSGSYLHVEFDEICVDFVYHLLFCEGLIQYGFSFSL